MEITEAVALTDITTTARFMDRLRQFGVGVALDDFGAGYTSFQYLKHLRADHLKLDGSLICELHKNPVDVSIVRNIVNLAHDLDVECVAEWVETEETLAILNQLSVDFGQGRLLEMPEPLAVHAGRVVRNLETRSTGASFEPNVSVAQI